MKITAKIDEQSISNFKPIHFTVMTSTNDNSNTHCVKISSFLFVFPLSNYLKLKLEKIEVTSAVPVSFLSQSRAGAPHLSSQHVNLEVFTPLP